MDTAQRSTGNHRGKHWPGGSGNSIALSYRIAASTQRWLPVVIFAALVLLFWPNALSVRADHTNCTIPVGNSPEVCRNSVTVITSTIPARWRTQISVNWGQINQLESRALLLDCADNSGVPSCVEMEIQPWTASTFPSIVWTIPDCVRPGTYWAWVQIRNRIGTTKTDKGLSQRSFEIDSGGLPCVYSVSLSRTEVEHGQLQGITWTSENQRSLQIDLHHCSGQKAWTILAKRTSSSKSHNWTVPSSIAPGQYYVNVQIWNSTNQPASKQTDCFTVLEPPPTISSVRVNPTTVLQGANQTITWSSTNQSAYQIELCQSSSPCSLLIGRTTSSGQSQTWTVPTNQTAGSYFVQVQLWNGSNVAVSGRSSPFTIRETPPTLTNVQVSPATVAPGAIQTITWTSTNQNLLQIDLLNSLGQRLSTILSRRSSTAQSHTWSVPGNQASGRYFIQVQIWNAHNQSETAQSNQFLIRRGGPIAVNDFAETTVGTPVTVPVLVNDSDPDNDPLTIVAVGNAANGTVSTNGTTVTYRPKPGFTGNDSFSYTISDGISTDSAIVTVNVKEVTVPPATLLAAVDLQGRPAKPAPSWAIPLVVTITPVGGGTPGQTFTPTSNQNGGFTLSGLTPGKYDIQVKGNHTLRNVTQNVNLVSGNNALNLGRLREGDVEVFNTFNRVATDDADLLQGSFNKCAADGGFVANADLNESGCVTMLDFGLLSGNFNQLGDVVITASSGQPSTVQAAASGNALLSFDVPEMLINVGEVATATIEINPRGEQVNGGMVHLGFDPTLVEVTAVNLTDQLPFVLEAQTIDNSLGVVRFGVGVLGQTLSSKFAVAEIAFKVKTDTPGTTISPRSTHPATDVSGPSGSVRGEPRGLTLKTITGAPADTFVFLPFLMK